jgi:hypothetical protein
MFGRNALQLLVATYLLVPAAARAADPIAAESLFDEGKQLMSENRYTEACRKFEESQKMDPGLGTQFHLADCWQHIGRMASAWATFREVESQARALGQVGRVRVAHDRATALEQSLSKVVVVPQADTPGMKIRRDGVEIGREQWDSPIPVDAGVHTVSASAPNRQAWETSVDVPPYGNVVTVEVPPLAEVPQVAVLPAPQPSAATGGPPPSSGPPTGVTESMPAGPAEKPVVESMPPPAEKPVVENRGGVQRGFAWFLAGAGVVGLGAGAYFGGRWLADRSSSNAHCLNDVCDATGIELRNMAQVDGRNAAVLLAGGGAAIVLGAVLVVTAPSAGVAVGPASASALLRPRARANMEVSPMIGLHEGGVRLGGAW